MITIKGMQKLIASGIALLLTLTALLVATFAILSTEKVGLSVSVSFDSAVTAKAYLATNSSTDINFKQPNDAVTAGNFAKANSAIIFNTYNTDTNGGKIKSSFEALGSGTSNGLKCDANGEMEFYVYVENYSTTESIYYKANITFTDYHGTSLFSVESNPLFKTSAIAGEVDDVSLLTFKIKAGESETEIRANTIQIEIILSSTLPLEWLGVSGKYDATNTSGMTVNYIGLYYIDLGEYPQTQETDVDIIAGIIDTPDENGYYTSSVNEEKYARKGTSPNFTYYKVEPVRWLVIGNGSMFNDFDFPNLNYDGFESNQLLLISEKILDAKIYHSSQSSNILWANTTIYNTHLPALKNLLFDDSVNLGTFDDGLKLSLLSYDLSCLYSNYLTSTSRLKASRTSWTGSPTGNEYYWLKNNKTYTVGSTPGGVKLIWNKDSPELSQLLCTYVSCIRPIILLNL